MLCLLIGIALLQIIYYIALSLLYPIITKTTERKQITEYLRCSNATLRLPYQVYINTSRYHNNIITLNLNLPLPKAKHLEIFEYQSNICPSAGMEPTLLTVSAHPPLATIQSNHQFMIFQNLPFNIYNRTRLTFHFFWFFGSGFSAPFLILWHQMRKNANS